MIKISGFIEIKPRPAVRTTGRSLWNKRSRGYFNYKTLIGYELHKLNLVKIEERTWLKLKFFFKGKCRADIDNLFKGFTDSANKILWLDDKQIKRERSEIIEGSKKEGIYFEAGSY